MAIKLNDELEAKNIGCKGTPTTTTVNGKTYYRMIAVKRVSDFGCGTNYTDQNRKGTYIVRHNFVPPFTTGARVSNVGHW